MIARAGRKPGATHCAALGGTSVARLFSSYRRRPEVEGEIPMGEFDELRFRIGLLTRLSIVVVTTEGR